MLRSDTATCYRPLYCILYAREACSCYALIQLHASLCIQERGVASFESSDTATRLSLYTRRGVVSFESSDTATRVSLYTRELSSDTAAARLYPSTPKTTTQNCYALTQLHASLCTQDRGVVSLLKALTQLHASLVLPLSPVYKREVCSYQCMRP